MGIFSVLAVVRFIMQYGVWCRLSYCPRHPQQFLSWHFWDSKIHIYAETLKKRQKHFYLIGVSQACWSGWLWFPWIRSAMRNNPHVLSDVRIENKICNCYSHSIVLQWEIAVNTGSEVMSFHGITAPWTKNLWVVNIPSILPQTSSQWLFALQTHLHVTEATSYSS